MSPGRTLASAFEQYNQLLYRVAQEWYGKKLITDVELKKTREALHAWSYGANEEALRRIMRDRTDS